MITKLSTPCIEWDGTRHVKGYGQITIRGRTVRAHRLAWEKANGPIPEGMMVCHKCDNPPCINPEHLFLGTSKDNAQDSIIKGRRWALRIGQCCRRGHLLTKDTLYTKPNGDRVCRQCHRASNNHSSLYK